jgi:serine/threonine protein kinase/WD40 repeat protein
MIDWNPRANDLFLRAAALETPAERRDFLDQHCGADAALRRQVEALLDAGQKLGSFLNRPAGLESTGDNDPAAPVALTEGPGTVIGPYKLLQQLGEGGFGVVFLAEQQEPVRRQVALKIIKPGLDSKPVLARFEQERQALALMDHPSIARVLDGGTTESGRPYFVMELVKGVPITAFCDQNRLTPRERLELFVQVCQAVQHAHQKGIIHRDLKPSNVLVTLYDDKPVPKVIDFGVAKAIEQQLTEKTLFTGVGQVVGTLEYMSPEQASLNALDVDTRSDVYALGVLLYELLTGSTPLNKERLQGVAFQEMLRLIREAEPQKPSTRLSGLGGGLSLMAAYRKTEAQKLPRLVAGELDWIAMKALDKDRARRYETASALAADVRRYLSEEPVEARPPSAWYRFRKMARRNRAAVTATALVAAVLLVGTVVAWLFALEASRNADWAYQEKDKADRQTVLARAHGETAKERATEIEKINTQLLASQENLQHSLNASDMKLVQFAWQSDDVGRVRDLLRKKIPGPGQTDHRHFEWHYWNKLVNGVETVVPLKGNDLGSRPVFSPDQSLLASLIVDKEKKMSVIRLWDTATGEVKKDLPGLALEDSPGGFGGTGAAFNQLTFSANGKRLAVGALMKHPRNFLGRRAELLLLDTETGNKLWHRSIVPEKGKDIPAYALALHPDGDRVAFWATDPKTEESVIQIWATKKDDLQGELVKTLSVPKVWKDAARNGSWALLAFSPDGKRLLAGALPGKMSEQKTENILLGWETDTGNQVLKVPSPTGGGAFELAISPDGKKIAAVWSGSSDPKTGESLPGVRELWLHDSTTGKKLIACSTGRPVSVLNPTEPAPETVLQIQFSPDANSLLGQVRASSLGCAVFKIWDTATGERRHMLQINTKMFMPAATFAAGGTKIFVTTENALQVWPVPKTGPVRVNAEPGQVLAGASLSGDGKRLAVGLSKPNMEIRVLDVTTGAKVFAATDLAPVRKFRLSTDGKRLAAHLTDTTPEPEQAKGGTVVLWDLEKGKKVPYPLPRIPDLKGFPGFAPIVQTIVHDFSADGRRVAYSYPIAVEEAAMKRVLKVYDFLSDKVILEHNTFVQIPRKRMVRRNGTVGRIQFSPDGSLLFVYEMRWRWTSEPNKKPNLIHVLDLEKGAERIAIPDPLPDDRSIKGPLMFISPDAKRIALCEGEVSIGPGTLYRDIVVLDVTTGEKLFHLTGHTQGVTGLAFSADGQRLASLAWKAFSSPEKGGLGKKPSSAEWAEIKFWDMHNGHEVLTVTPKVPVNLDSLLQFSADGNRLMLLTPEHPADSGGAQPGGSWYELNTWDATPLPATPQ